MQKYVRVLIFLSLVVCSACQQQEQKGIQEEILSEEQTPFLPVTDFILGQLNELDQLPVSPLRISIDGDVRDSVWMKREDMRRLASPFLHPLIDSLSMTKYFIGKSFLDQTINAYTFSYDAKTKLPDSIVLIHWDVYIDPQKNNVQRIYMVKEDTLNAGHVTTQLTWTTGAWFSIRTIVQFPDKEPRMKEELIKWNFNDE
ncbi:MAG: hypothetical protein ABIO76_00515 [Ginsengibacter sp.]